MRNGIQANPLSIQMVFREGNRSGSPLMTQLVIWTMLQWAKVRACTEMKRFMVRTHWSASQVGPAWKAMGWPVCWMAAYSRRYLLSCTGSKRRLVTR